MAVSRYFSNSQLAERVNIASGKTLGVSHINKFGFTGTDTGASTIWDANGNGDSPYYPYPAAGVVAATSGQNSGASVEVQGLDANYAPQTVTVTIGGSASTETFSRVFRARMVDTNNDANVDITVGGSLAARILTDNGQTLMAVYTVPAGCTAYLMKFVGTTDKANVDVKFKIFARPFGGTFNLKGEFGTQGGNPIMYEYMIPLEFTEKTDIKIDIDNSSTAGCGATFDLLITGH